MTYIKEISVIIRVIRGVLSVALLTDRRAGRTTQDFTNFTDEWNANQKSSTTYKRNIRDHPCDPWRC
jgi:hypothetical protein